jgi:hypothetical protein
MAIERKNSFHLMLSDDELTLLHMLAEQAGQNASDYLRTVMRQLAGTPPHLKQMIHINALLGGRAELVKKWTELTGAASTPARSKPAPKKRASKRAK